MKAVILLGGETSCSRFRPISFNRVKPLFPIAGLPMVQHHLESLQAVGNITEVLLFGFYEESQFNSFIKNVSSNYQFKVRYLKESSELGSAGSLFYFRDQILENSSNCFIVINVDTVTDINLKEMIEFAKTQVKSDPEMGGVLLGANPVNVVSSDTVGFIRKDENNMILNYIEKPEKIDRNLAQYVNAGVYVFTPNLFKEIGEIFLQHSQRRNSQRSTLSYMRGGGLKKNTRYMSFSTDTLSISLERHVFPRIAETNVPLYVYPHNGFWGHLKMPADTLKANEVYLQKMATQSFGQYKNYTLATGDNIIGNVYIAENAEISQDAKVGPNVVIGKKTIVKAGARIKNSIIMDNCICKENSFIVNSVVGWNSLIGHWARVQGTLDYESSKLFVGGKKSFTITSLGEHVMVANEVLVRDSVVLPHMKIINNCVNEIRL